MQLKMYLKRLILSILSAIALASCQTNLEFNTGQLQKVSIINYQIKSDTLIVTYSDNSLNFFEDYNALKNNVFAYLNMEVLKKHKAVIINSKFPDSKLKSKFYNQKDLTFVENLHNNNPIFKDFAIHLTSKFNTTDWWNLNYAITLLNEHKGEIGKNPVDLIFKYSTLNTSNIKESPVTQRIITLGQMIKQGGLIDAFTKKQISAYEFIDKYNYFLSQRNLTILK